MMTATQALDVFKFGKTVTLPDGKREGTVIGTSLEWERAGGVSRMVLRVKVAVTYQNEASWPHYEFPLAKRG